MADPASETRFSARREEMVRRWWAGELDGYGRVLSLLLWPAELCFRTGVAIRNAAYDRGIRAERRPPIPVISVGNLSVGGTGKTPVCGWLIRELLGRGHRPALVTRGYGADEVALHRRWNPEAPVHVAARRIDGVEEAARRGADAAVVDDGFQHRALARDLDIVLVAAEERLPAPLLPRGPYREPLSALERADLLLVTRRTAAAGPAEEVAERLAGRAPDRPVGIVHLRPGPWTDLAGDPAPSPEPRGGLLAVCSVARPDTFRGLVRERTGRTPDLLAFPDHHPYVAADARSIAERAGNRLVVTTEKDAVKLLEFRRELPPVRVLPLEVRMERGAEELADRLDRVPGGRAP